jgi:hypothetical protein
MHQSSGSLYGNRTTYGLRQEMTLHVKKLDNGKFDAKGYRSRFRAFGRNSVLFRTLIGVMFVVHGIHHMPLLHSFRDRLHTDYRSSSKAKISRRKEAAIEPSVQDFDEFMAQNALPLSPPIGKTPRNTGNTSLEVDDRKPGKAECSSIEMSTFEFYFHVQ